MNHLQENTPLSRTQSTWLRTHRELSILYTTTDCEKCASWVKEFNKLHTPDFTLFFIEIRVDDTTPNSIRLFEEWMAVSGHVVTKEWIKVEDGTVLALRFTIQ